MTTDDFKLWFEGFADALDGPPNAEQWDTIREKLADATAVPTMWEWNNPWTSPNVPINPPQQPLWYIYTDNTTNTPAITNLTIRSKTMQ